MLPTLEAPELIFGICSPIGTKNSRFVDLLKSALIHYGYKLEAFKVTDLMKSVQINGQALIETPTENRYDSYIKYANKFREITEIQGALAILCCAAVRAFRRSKESTSYIKHQAFIFDQFKREEEINVLRQIYGKSFIQISLYSEKGARTSYLMDRISTDHATSRPDSDHESIAKNLVKRDQDEEGVPHGQRLRAAYPLADLFLNMDDLVQSGIELSRFLALFFGSNKHSPTKNEYGMYIAKSAALRSLDLSRQVGAAIFTEDGEVLT